MNKVTITQGTSVSVGASTSVMISIEGGSCRLYTGSVPTDKTAGHMVLPGYQIIVPAGLNVYATAENGEKPIAIVGEFGA